MKVFAVSGLHGTGKTTVVEHLVRELVRRGLKVATVKDIHYEGFTMDKEGTNTWRHRAAGACTVAARGLRETDFVYGFRMPMEEVVSRIEADVVVIEGAHDEPYPRITCATMPEEADMRKDSFTFAFSGRLSDTTDEHDGLKVYDCEAEAAGLADLALEKALDVEPAVRER
ncbi:MAG TPA: molybdopterin-guanine dinucleotide biosynthesis protein B [Bacillota bacterium]|nr:MAG: Molybdopterin-guanine dinucleotide biosynthesis adapter protein [Firmicutes bacterium ADurb.Bin153]HNV34118.1 molybdopterin-guanine dinucleotide biosynthesis protein B [Bacillota bacterium]